MTSFKVMITGVYGMIAGALYSELSRRSGEFEVHGLARRRENSKYSPKDRRLVIPDDRFTLTDLSDIDELTEAFRGMDVIIHMAAQASERGSWESILQGNICGTYHTLEASKRAGVKRVIFASSIQVDFGYRNVEPYTLIIKGERNVRDTPELIVDSMAPVRPPNLYACSKVWGEALARMYSEEHGLSCLCIRIGHVTKDDKPSLSDYGDVWCSQRDFVNLVTRCIEAPLSLRFDVFYGMSDNMNRWVDLEHAREKVGYVSKDRSEDYTG